MVNAEMTQDSIKHQDTELFDKVFNGFNPLNTFEKFSASGVWQSSEFLCEIFNIIQCMK